MNRIFNFNCPKLRGICADPNTDPPVKFDAKKNEKFGLLNNNGRP